jgi:uncharacterized protein (DUF736 family)
MGNKNNQGVLFRNAKKDKDTQPDYKGSGMYDGIEFEVSAWVRKSEKGNEYLSLAFKQPFVKDNPERPYP